MTELAYRLTFGDLTCVALRGAEGSPQIRLSDLLLPPGGDEANRPEAERATVIEGAHSCLLAILDDRRILIDGGFDAATVRAGLSEVGVEPASIDFILITHGDTDHIAGLVDEEQRLVYPEARYALHRQLWEAWISDGERGDPNPFYEERQRQIARALAGQIADRVLLFDGDAKVAPGIRSIASPGHRPSHLAFELSTGNHRLLHLGDAMIAPVFLDDLSRGNVFDTDPKLGIESRLEILRRAVEPETLAYVPHFPFPGFIRIEQRGDRFEQVDV